MEVNTLLIKLASIAVHIEEMFSKGGHEFDRRTVQSLLSDPEVRDFLDDPDNSVFLPLKRNL